MKTCPFMTIARLMSHPHQPGHAVCLEQECALWSSRTGSCAFVSLPDSVDMLIAASITAGVVPPFNITPSPPP